MSEFPVNKLSARKFSAEVVNDALREEITTLRKALEKIAKQTETTDDIRDGQPTDGALIAREALEGR